MPARRLFGTGMLGCFPDAVAEGLYTLEGGQTSTGSVIDWCRRTLAAAEAREAERAGRSAYEALDARAAAAPAGSDGLVCLDYFQGNRCPFKQPRARGG